MGACTGDELMDNKTTEEPKTEDPKTTDSKPDPTTAANIHA